MGNFLSTTEPNLKDIVNKQKEIEKTEQVSQIKPESFETSTTLNLDPKIDIDITLSEKKGLNLDTDTSSEEQTEQKEQTEQTQEQTEQIQEQPQTQASQEVIEETDKETDADNLIEDIDNETTEQIITRMIKKVEEHEQQGGSYKRKYNKRAKKNMNGGCNYCGKVNKQTFDNQPVNIGAY